MSTRATIHDKICDIIDTISATIVPVKYRYPESKPSSFPATMTLFIGDEEKMVDSANNLTSYHFLVRTVYPIDESATGYQKWLTLYDTITAELRKDDHETLTGSAVKFMIESDGQPAFSEQYSQPVAVLDIRVTAEVLQSII
ncbi:hypothetical protein A2245_03550 [candidate division WWE3 bacterium RIFOXYA2_FULL_43_12]|nr:MAG: hypothetical protein A2245_03550 [candidate division WWE3 bacterium RIFOXYA2_FULL_43_12]